MKILAMGDIHDMTGGFESIENRISSADVVILTGDLTQLGGTEEASAVISALRLINMKILAQPGNMDSIDISRYLSREGINLHGRGRIYDDVGIFGVGGSNITPFHTPVEFSEEELTGFLKNAFLEVQEARVKILISHTPPYNTTVDRIRSGAHVGSQAVRDFIEKYEPDLCITGHIHEAAGEDMIGKTKIINPGLFSEGGFVSATVVNGVLHAELHFIT